MNIHTDFTANDKDVQKALYRMEQSITKLTEKNKQLERQSEKGGKKATADIDGLIKRYVSFAAVVGTATKALTDMHQVRVKAAQDVRAAAGGMGGLSELAGTEKEMERLRQRARQTYRMGAGETQDEAANLVFAVESAQQQEFHNLFALMQAAKPGSDVAGTASAVNKLQKSMGRKEAGGAPAILSKMYGASSFAPAKAPQILTGTAEVGEAASRLGLTDEEAFALIGTASQVWGPETGTTYVNQMLRSLAGKEEFAGKGNFAGMVKKVQGMGLGLEEGKKFWGREQGMAAFGVLAKNMPEYEKILGDVRKAQEQETVYQKLAFAEGTPEVKARIEHRQAMAGKELGETTLGIEQLGYEADIAKIKTRMRARGVSGLGIWGAGAVADTLNFLGATPGYDPSQVTPGVADDFRQGIRKKAFEKFGAETQAEKDKVIRLLEAGVYETQQLRAAVQQVRASSMQATHGE